MTGETQEVSGVIGRQSTVLAGNGPDFCIREVTLAAMWRRDGEVTWEAESDRLERRWR